MNKQTLISRDSKGKIRVVEISYAWDDDQEGFVIKRFTSQYGGKITTQPDILIKKGKVKRTVTEQAQLEYNSKINGYKDKGYKEIPGDLTDYTLEQLNEFLPDDPTDSNGVKKVMSAKDFNKVATSVYDKIDYWYASKKLDGVRLLMFWNGKEIKTASKGGKEYNNSTYHITVNKDLINWFKSNPDKVLDGELYVHGRPLQWISGTARLKKEDARTDELEFWVFDIMMEGTFEERLSALEDFQFDICTGTDLDLNLETDNHIRTVQHVKVSGWANIKKLHDDYVNEGFEGVVIRNPNEPYGYNKRTNAMIKIKEYQDDEFEIIGYSEGLRDEDMVFVCKTSDGKEFEAKPMGARELKYEYLERMDEIIGKMATVKFFIYSEDGVPMQPTLKAIRDYE